MFAENKLKVEFAAPEHGWTVVNLSAGEDSYRFAPSHVPYDSFGELLRALLNVIDGVHALVRWNDEPVKHKFVFTCFGKGFVNLKVYEIVESIGGGNFDRERFSFAGSLYEVLRPFWKGLRDMQSRQSAQELKRHWQWSFPESEISELTEKLKCFKTAVY